MLAGGITTSIIVITTASPPPVDGEFESGFTNLPIVVANSRWNTSTSR